VAADCRSRSTITRLAASRMKIEIRARVRSSADSARALRQYALEQTIIAAHFILRSWPLRRRKIRRGIAGFQRRRRTVFHYVDGRIVTAGFTIANFRTRAVSIPASKG